MSTQKRYPRLSLAAFLTAVLCGVLGFVQAEGFFVLSAFLALVGIILRNGVGDNLDVAWHLTVIMRRFCTFLAVNHENFTFEFSD